MAQRRRLEEDGEDAVAALRVQELRAAGVARLPMRLRMERLLRVDPRRQRLLARAARPRAGVSRTGLAMEQLRRES